MQAFVGYVTTPVGAAATALARGLVESGAATCVNIVPLVTSVYAWKGAVDTSEEALLIVKTAGAARCDAVISYVRAHHTYECPEVVFVPVASGNPPYLAWLAGGGGK